MQLGDCCAGGSAGRMHEPHTVKRCLAFPWSRRPAMNRQDEHERHEDGTGQEFGPVTRRTVLAGMAAGILSAGNLAASPQGAERSGAEPKGARTADGIPGPFPGRVVEVAHAGSVVGDAVQEPIAATMVERGMRDLAGSPDA